MARVPVGNDGSVVKAPPEAPETPETVAHQFFATVTKVQFFKDGTRLPFIKSPKKGLEDEASVAVSPTVQVVHGTFTKMKKALKAGLPVAGGLKNAIFTKPVRCWLVLNDKEVVTEIRVSPKQAKMKTELSAPSLGAPASFSKRLAMEFVLVAQGKFWRGGGKPCATEVRVGHAVREINNLSARGVKQWQARLDRPWLSTAWTVK